MKNKVFNYLTLIFVIASFALVTTTYFYSGLQLNVFTLTGLLLMVPSLVLFSLARIQLGNSFNVKAVATKLVTEGLYKKIRHPIYLFAQIFLLGFFIFLQNFYLLIPWVLIIFMQKIRSIKEDKVLEEKFGDEYRQYKKNTWF